MKCSQFYSIQSFWKAWFTETLKSLYVSVLSKIWFLCTFWNNIVLNLETEFFILGFEWKKLIVHWWQFITILLESLQSTNLLKASFSWFSWIQTFSISIIFLCLHRLYLTYHLLEAIKNILNKIELYTDSWSENFSLQETFNP